MMMSSLIVLKIEEAIDSVMVDDDREAQEGLECGKLGMLLTN